MVFSSMPPGFSRPRRTSSAMRTHGVGDLGPTAVVHAEVESQAGVVAGEVLGDLELVDDRPPQPRASTDPPHPDAPLVQLVAAPSDHVAVEAHEEADLVRGAPPVLGRERVRRQVGHADLDRPGHDVEQRGLAGLVALRPGQSAGVGPTAVAVHDDGHVLREELGRDRRGSGTARVRERRRIRAGGHRRSALGDRARRGAASAPRARGATGGTPSPVHCPHGVRAGRRRRRGPSLR